MNETYGRSGKFNRRSTDEIARLRNSHFSRNYSEIINARLVKSMAFTKGQFLPWVIAVASLVLLGLLVLVPCAVLFLAISSESAFHRLFLFHFPVICWAVWAVVSLWAALDSPKMLRTLGWSVDPLGSYGVWGMLLGVLNIGASLLAVMLRTHR
jgi:hypothetical protein